MADVIVIGGSGFVGRAVCEAVERRGAHAVPLRAPRIRAHARSEADTSVRAAADLLRAALSGAAAVVNAAGLPDAASDDTAALEGANALVPMAIALACAEENIRLVHVSSAAVQGRHSPLDDSRSTHPLTPYASSKAQGERLVLERCPGAVVYRPPGVHGPARSVTRSLSQLASSPVSSVAAPGDHPAPHVLIDDVGDAVAFLALHPDAPPAVVHHPPSGQTTTTLLRLLGGGREPRRIPRPVARGIVALARTAGRVSASTAAQARRLEVLWFGQEQAESWLTAQGWHSSTTDDDWRRLGRLARQPIPTSPSVRLPHRKPS